LNLTCTYVMTASALLRTSACSNTAQWQKQIYPSCTLYPLPLPPLPEHHPPCTLTQGPYLVESTAAQLDQFGYGAGYGADSYEEPQTPASFAAQSEWPPSSSAAHSNTQDGTTQGAGCSTDRRGGQHGLHQELEQQQKHGPQRSKQHESRVVANRRGGVGLFRAWAVLRAWQARQWLASKWGTTIAAAVRPAASFAARLHLALFYMWGVYYQLSQRLAGVRFVSIARPLQQ